LLLGVVDASVLLLTVQAITPQGERPIATLDVESKYVPNKPLEALRCYRTSSLEHPGVQMISMERGKYYLGGKVTGTTKPSPTALRPAIKDQSN
jgi:ATP sulfurylase